MQILVTGVAGYIGSHVVKQLLLETNYKIIEKMKWRPKHNNLELICKTALEWEEKITNE